MAGRAVAPKGDAQHMNRVRVHPWRCLILLSALVCVMLAGCGEGNDGDYANAEAPAIQDASIVLPHLSGVARQGAELFAANCSECHGGNAGGSSQGPPLIHIIYEPGHHADLSFHLAVNQGSRQHHWQFGDMEPVTGLSPQEVNRIICYVREIQYANGVFSDPAGLVACQG